MRMELTEALHHSASKGAGPETHDAPRSQKTVNSMSEAELFTLFEEELGGTRPGRLSDVRPQERVQRRNVEQLVVVAAPGLPGVPQLQFLAKVVLVAVQRQVLWSKQCRTLFGSSQLQFLEKVIDVPVISTTCARGGPDTVLGQGY